MWIGGKEIKIEKEIKRKKICSKPPK